MCDQTRAQRFLGQRIARRIDDIDEVKPCRRCRRARARAISLAHQLDDPLDRLLATTDSHQGARDIAHHVMQEGIGLDIDHDDMVMTTDFNEVHVAARRTRLTACSAEGRKIQLAHQMRRRGLHVGDIERLADRLLDDFEGRAEVENHYARGVPDDGNPVSLAAIADVYEERPSFEWRGLGEIDASGLRIRAKYAAFDAEEKFQVGYAVGRPTVAPEPEGCACGAVMTGRIKPTQCPQFGTGCTPEMPLGASSTQAGKPPFGSLPHGVPSSIADVPSLAFRSAIATGNGERSVGQRSQSAGR